MRYETSSSVEVGYTAVASPPPVTEAAKPSAVPETETLLAVWARAARPAAMAGAERMVMIQRVCAGKLEKKDRYNDNERTLEPAR